LRFWFLRKKPSQPPEFDHPEWNPPKKTRHNRLMIVQVDGRARPRLSCFDKPEQHRGGYILFGQAQYQSMDAVCIPERFVLGDSLFSSLWFFCAAEGCLRVIPKKVGWC
jgi:hypothetical protein